MALTLTATDPVVTTVLPMAGWTDVARVIDASCAARAGAAALWRHDGAVAVLAGPAPILWVHGPVDADAVVGAVAPSSVREAYVASPAADRCIDGLVAAGWRRSDVTTELVADAPAGPGGIADRAVVELGPADVPGLRDLLRRQGAEEHVLTASYPDDFFTVAAPVRVFGYRAPDGSLAGAVAVRRQADAALGFALNVDRAVRRHGVATGLVRTAVGHALADGARFVHAQAAGVGVEVLERCGFARVGSWQRLIR